MPSEKRLSTIGWGVANLSVVVTVTSGILSLVQSPIDSLRFNKIQTKRYLPPLSLTQVGVTTAFRFLYSGLTAHFASSSIRSAYTITAKKIPSTTEPHTEIEARLNEQAIEPGKHNLKSSSKNMMPFGVFASISLGETLLTQVPGVISDLKKLKTIDSQFKWRSPNNFYKLATTGVVAKFSGAMVNFTALCLIEDKIHRRMPFKNEPLNHLLAGALCGMTAAVGSFPFHYYREVVVLSKARVIDGQLTTRSLPTLIKDTMTEFKKVGGTQIAKDVLNKAAEQLPLRMARTASAFAVICAVGAALTNEPLAKIGFFAPHQQQADKEITPQNPAVRSNDPLSSPVKK